MNRHLVVNYIYMHPCKHCVTQDMKAAIENVRGSRAPVAAVEGTDDEGDDAYKYIMCVPEWKVLSTHARAVFVANQLAREITNILWKSWGMGLDGASSDSFDVHDVVTHVSFKIFTKKPKVSKVWLNLSASRPPPRPPNRQT